MAQEQPSGLQSTTGSNGEYADRKSSPGFPNGQVQTVSGSASAAGGR